MEFDPRACSTLAATYLWLLMGFFKSIPKDIEEAAMVDGCGRARAIVQIIMPISLAGILSAVIFAFTLTIQEFTYALTFPRAGSRRWGGVPTFLDRFISGFTVGAIK
jgi:multiple sugar transport system permease protein